MTEVAGMRENYEALVLYGDKCFGCGVCIDVCAIGRIAMTGRDYENN